MMEDFVLLLMSPYQKNLPESVHQYQLFLIQKLKLLIFIKIFTVSAQIWQKLHGHEN